MIAFTHHAVERYLQFHRLDDRTDPRDATQVRAMLEEAATRAVKLPEKTRRGHTMWQLQELGIEIVTKHDNGVDVCVTILPPPRLRGLDPRTAELVEAKIRDLETRKSALEEERHSLSQGAPMPLPTVEQLASEIDPAQEPTAFRYTADISRVAALVSTKAAKKAAHDARCRRIEELKLELSIISQELALLPAILKTMRHAITSDRTMANLKRAMKIAVKRLRMLPPEQTKDTFHRIWMVDPGLVSDKFVDDETSGDDEQTDEF